MKVSLTTSEPAPGTGPRHWLPGAGPRHWLPGTVLACDITAKLHTAGGLSLRISGSEGARGRQRERGKTGMGENERRRGKEEHREIRAGK